MRSAGTGFGLLITSLIIRYLVFAVVFVVAAESMAVSCDQHYFAIAERAALVCELVNTYTVATIEHTAVMAVAHWYSGH